MWFYTGEFRNGYKTDADGNILLNENGNKIEEFVTAKYDFLIDWGDGSALEHYDRNSSTDNNSATNHYTELG